MPREQKKRGRREEKKRKREEDESDPSSNKKLKEEVSAVDAGISTHNSYAAPQYTLSTIEPPIDMPFYGLLDEEEQEYFRRADEMLELNQFADADERDLFVTNVYREAKGKELKIANSQSCSRLMERLISISNSQQLKALFRKFSGQYVAVHLWNLVLADFHEPASSILCSIDSHLIVAKLCLSNQRQLSPRNSPPLWARRSPFQRMERFISQWKTCFSIHSTNSKVTWAI